MKIKSIKPNGTGFVLLDELNATIAITVTYYKALELQDIVNSCGDKDVKIEDLECELGSAKDDLAERENTIAMLKDDLSEAKVYISALEAQTP